MKKLNLFLLAVLVSISLFAQNGTKFMWMTGEQEGAFVEVNAFSDNKEFIVGTVSKIAFIYHVKESKMTYLTSSDIKSSAWDVSNEGIVVGSYGEDLQSQACYWDKEGNMMLLSEQAYGSRATGISPDGKLIVGHLVAADDAPVPGAFTSYYWEQQNDNTYQMNPFQTITEEELGQASSGMFIRGMGSNGAVLATVQADNGSLPLVYFNSCKDKPVYFAKDSLLTLNMETWQYEGDQPFIECTGEEISENGEWICCTVSKPFTENGQVFQHYYSSAYSIKENKFYTNNKLLRAEQEPAGGVIDNYGNMVGTVTDMDAMIGRYVIYIHKGEEGFTPFTDYIREWGVDTEPFESAIANTVMAISGDGKMIAGFASIDYQIGWVFDAESTLLDPTSMKECMTEHPIGQNCYVTGNTLRLHENVLRVSIYSVAGSELMSASPIDQEINLSHLPSGIYTVKLTGKDQTATSKIVIR